MLNHHLFQKLKLIGLNYSSVDIEKKEGGGGGGGGGRVLFTQLQHLEKLNPANYKL
jgi:hypothetical protein